ncbi:hypothetical protein CTAYLR_002309 [Chrysophaeum taylorii]|uniref:Membrane transport protein MMPL domain-containing protein n=1 Tax=Chrysophaeum taylorii TaxID=2483200 RepID=A0AAD7XRJ4_9STRA|nr:hypothetical protein CTAYLR_002309 [Chrysophaeum taylorii]
MEHRNTWYTTLVPAPTWGNIGEGLANSEAGRRPKRRSVAWHWTKAIWAVAWPVIGVFTGASLCAIPFARVLVDRTTSRFGSLSGSASQKASRRLARWFPGLASAATATAVGSVDCSREQNLTIALREKFGDECDTCFIRQVAGGCAFLALNATYVADWYRHDNAAISIVSYDSGARHAKINEFLEWLSERTAATGFDYFSLEASKGVANDLHTLDTRSVPAALCVLAVVVGYPPLLVVPVVATTCSMLLAFAVTGSLARFVDIPSFGPSVMTTIVTSLSLDYSLFLCARFVQARRSAGRRSRFQRLLETVIGAGGTIAVSAATLLCCFLGLLAFPSDIVRGVGVALAVGATFSALVSLTLAPALLCVAGEPLCAFQEAVIERMRDVFFRRPPRANQGEEALEMPLTREPPANDESSLDESSSSSDDEASQEEDNNSFWYVLGRLLWDDRRVAITIAVVIAAACAPLAFYYSPRLKISADPVGLAPSPSPPERALERLEATFGAGAFAQYTLLFESSRPFDDAYLDATDDILEKIDADFSRSLARLGDRKLAAADYASCRGGDEESAFCASLGVISSAFLRAGSETTVSIARVSLRVNPYSSKGLKWLARARRVLEDDDFFNRVSLSGSPASLNDLLVALYDVFPTVAAATLAVVFVFLGLVFRSLAVALRSVLALTMTLAVSFASCLAVYVRGGGGGPAFLTTRGSDPGLVWIAPLLCFSVIVGASVDYDVFLLCAVHEYRMRRFSDRDSLLLAMRRTGRVVTSAGLIMACAFGGLFFSKACVLNQVAWLLVTAVLFDTLLVRALFMPSLISLSRHRAWWPATLPPPRRAPTLLVSM